MKLAAMMQGVVTLPKRTWVIVSALALASGAALAAIYGAWTPAPVRSSQPVIPAQPATDEVTAIVPVAPEVPTIAEAPAAPQPRRFLPETHDESVVLETSTQGCFGGSGPERFEIHGENPGVVRVLDPEDGSVRRKVKLTARRRKELERTIAFYRAPPGDVVCSTVDTIHISFRQGGKVVWSETYEDSTCETAYQDSPWSLAALFDAERRAGRDERMSRELTGADW